MWIIYAPFLSGLAAAYATQSNPSQSESAVRIEPSYPCHVIYANTVIINVTNAHADEPKKTKRTGMKTKIGLSMFRAAADTYLEEKSKQDDRK